MFKNFPIFTVELLLYFLMIEVKITKITDKSGEFGYFLNNSRKFWLVYLIYFTSLNEVGTFEIIVIFGFIGFLGSEIFSGFDC